MNILKFLIPRSKVYFLRKYLLILLSCTISLSILYFYSKDIKDLAHNRYIEFYKLTSNFLINLGLSTDNIIFKGNNIVQYSEISKLINKQDSLLLLSLSDLKKRILKENPWIKTIIIKRTLPNTLEFNIEEYKPFANHFNQGLESVIDETGYTIVKNFKLENIFSIYGSIKKTDLIFVKKVLESDKNVTKLISSFTRVNNRRWNITFFSGLEIKLPEVDPYNSWDYLLHLHTISKSFLNWKVIDMRIANKIFIKK